MVPPRLPPRCWRRISRRRHTWMPAHLTFRTRLPQAPRCRAIPLPPVRSTLPRTASAEATGTNNGFDTITRDIYGLWTTGASSTFTCPIAGWYLLTYYTGALATATTGQYVQAQIRQNNATTVAVNSYSGQTTYVTYVTVTERIYCAAGDTLACWVQTQVAMNTIASGLGQWCHVAYQGTG